MDTEEKDSTTKTSFSKLLQRCPVKVIEPEELEAVCRHNFKREFYASRGEALSRFRLYKLVMSTQTLCKTILEQDDGNEVLRHARRLAGVNQLNTMFHQCLCLQDQKFLAHSVYEDQPALIPMLCNMAQQGSPLTYVTLQSLINFAWDKKAANCMIENDAIEILLGLLSSKDPNLLFPSIELCGLLLSERFPDRLKLLCSKRAIKLLIALGANSRLSKDELSKYTGDAAIDLLKRILEQHPQNPAVLSLTTEIRNVTKPDI